MADFMLTGDLDLTPAKKEVQEYLAFLRAESGKASATPTDTGANVPSKAAAADKQRLEVQKKLIDAQAKLVALKQQEARISSQGSGKAPDLAGIKSAGLKEIESVIPGMTPAQKGRFTKAVNSQVAAIETQLKGLSGNDLSKAFNEIAASVNTQAAASARSAATSQSEATHTKTAADKKKAAENREVRAAEQSASSAEQKAKTNAATVKQNLKFSREKFNGQNTGDLVARTGPKERDRYKVEKIQPEGASWKEYGVTYPGRDRPDDVFPTQREAKAAAEAHAEQARLAEGQAALEKKALSEAESTQTASKKLDAEIIEEKKKRLAALSKRSFIESSNRAETPDKVFEYSTLGKNAKGKNALVDVGLVKAKIDKDLAALSFIETGTRDPATKGAGFGKSIFVDSLSKLRDDGIKTVVGDIKGISDEADRMFQSMVPSGLAKLTKEGTRGDVALYNEFGTQRKVPGFKDREYEFDLSKIDAYKKEAGVREDIVATSSFMASLQGKEAVLVEELLALKAKEVGAEKKKVAAAEKEVLKPDEVIPPVQPKKDVVRVGPREPIDVQSATQEEKRAHVRAYAEETLRQQAEGTKGDKPIEAGIGQAKEEELLAAREAARIEKEATAKLAEQTARQTAAEARTTKAKEAESGPEIISTPQGDFVRIEEVINKEVLAEQVKAAKLKEQQDQQVAAETEVTAAKRRKVRLAQAEADVLKNLLAVEKNAPGKVVGKDFIYDENKADDVQAYFENQKRISAAAGSDFGRGQERLGAASSRILNDVTAQANAEINFEKSKEASAARRAAELEAESVAKKEKEEVQQAAADRQTTQAKKAEAQAAEANAEKLKYVRTTLPRNGGTSYSTVSDQTGAGYIIDKRNKGAGSRYEVFDDQYGSLGGDVRPETFTKLQDAKDYIQKLDDQRAANAEAQLRSEQEQLAQQEAQNVKQTAADSKITEAKTEQATAAKKLSAAQARAVNLVADGGVTKEQLKEQGVKASTVRSLEKSGAISEKPDGTLQASDAAIVAAKQTQLGAVQQQTVAETQAAATATAAAAKEAELAALKDQLKAQIRKGIITVQEANAKYLTAGGVGDFNRMKSAVPASQLDETPAPKPRRTRDQIINDEEGNLVDALRRKIKALNAQARVLEQKYSAFSAAEALLIDSLNRKAKALQKQIQAIEAGEIVVPQNVSQPKKTKETTTAPTGVTPVPDTGTTKPKSTPGGTPKGLDLDDFFDDNADVNAAEEQADAARIAAANVEKTAAEAKSLEAQKVLSESFDADYAAVIAAEEAADAARIKAASAEELAAARKTASAAKVTSTYDPVSPAQFSALKYYEDYTEGAEGNKKLAAVRVDKQYTSKNVPDGFDALDVDQSEAAEAAVARAFLQYAQIIGLVSSEFLDDFVDIKAATQALQARLSGMISSAVIGNETYLGDASRGKAESTVANTVIGAKSKAEILGDEGLQQQYIQARLELLGLTRAEAQSIALRLADDPLELKSAAELLIAQNKYSSALLRAARETEGFIGSQADLLTQKTMNRALTKQEALNDPAYLESLRLDQVNRLQERRARSGNPQGMFGKITQGLGYDRSGGGSLTEFFGGGALSSLRYGLPSMLLYGAGSGIANTIKEAEELQYNLSRLEGQFNAVFAGQDFGPVRKEILGVAQETGLAADEIANLQIQLTGAFGTGVEIGGLKEQDLVKSQVASAAKLAQTVGLPLAEITDGLTAASLAFNASFEDIGDVALALEEESGVLAKETVSFIGDIAPVAKEAGYSLEEFSAIAAVAQQRSGRSGAALAESFGRVIPALTEQKDKLLELAAIEPSLSNDSFFDAIRQSNPKEILDQIGQAYVKMSKEGQQATVNLLGGRREAQAIIPAIANQALVSRYVRDAEESAGTLEGRFKKVQGTLTNAMQRIGEAVRQLGVELLEAGLTDVFDNAIAAAGLLLKAISPIVKAIGAVNDALSGIPISILLAVGAYKLLTRAMTRVPLDPKTGLPMVGMNGQVVERVSRFDREKLTNRDTYTPRIVRDYRERLAGTAVDPMTGQKVYGQVLPGAMQTGQQSRFRAGAGALKTSGGNFVRGLDPSGSGSLAVGGAFLGVTALASLYGWANDQMDKERANLEELNREIDEGNSEVDFDIPNARSNRVKELEAQAQEAREAYGGWSKFWREFGNTMTNEERLLGEAAALDSTPEYRKAEEILAESTSLRSDLFKDYQAKLGKKTAPLRDLFQSYDKYSNAAIEEIDGTLKLVARGKNNEPIAQTTLDQQDTEYLNTIADQLGLRDVSELDFGFVSAALAGDNGVEILNIAKGDPEAIAKYGETAVENAQAYVEYIYGVGANSSKYGSEIDSIIAGLKEVSPLQETQLNIEELGAAFDLGLIGLEEYSSRMSKELETLEKQISNGDQTAATELELLKLQQQKAAIEKAISEAIANRGENLKKIAEVLGTPEKDIQASTIQVGLANLNNPLLTDQDTRLQIAIDIVEAQKAFDLKAAADAGNFAEVQRIYAEGVKLSPEVRAVFFTSSLETNDIWQELINGVDSFVKDFLDSFDQADFAKGVDSVLKGAARDKAKADFGDFDPESLAEDVFVEVFDDVEGISKGLSASLEGQAKTFAAQLSDEGLSKEEREALEKSLAFIIALMNFAGYSADAIAAALGGTGNVGGTDVGGIIAGNTDANNPLGTPPPATAKPDAEDLAKRQDSVAAAEFEYRRALADQNSLEIARLNKEEADRERWRAETGEFESQEEKDAAIWTAKANQVKASYEERDAYKALSDSRFEYLQAIAEVNGDMLQVAQLEVQKLQADLEMARASGDPNADAIAGQLLLAQDNVRKQLVESRGLDFELFATYLESEGDIVNAALTRVKQAEFNLANAKPGDDTKRAQMELINANKALRDAQATERNSAYGLFSTVIAREDPVAQAKIALALAKENLAAARGTVEKADAQKAVIEAQRQVEDAMAAARLSMFSLRQAELQAMDDQIGAAQVAVEMARQQLNDAISQGQGTAAINQARAGLVSAEKQLADTIINEKLDEYKWLLDMGQITQSQYIKYLESLQSTLAPGSKQFKDLALTIKQLKDGIQGDLQANLPTSLALPTLYEVRRFDQTAGSSGPASGGGYQDNSVRTIGSVNVIIEGAGSNVAGEVIKVLEDYTGTNRNGMGDRRY